MSFVSGLEVGQTSRFPKDLSNRILSRRVSDEGSGRCRRGGTLNGLYIEESGVGSG